MSRQHGFSHLSYCDIKSENGTFRRHIIHLWIYFFSSHIVNRCGAKKGWKKVGTRRYKRAVVSSDSNTCSLCVAQCHARAAGCKSELPPGQMW